MIKQLYIPPEGQIDIPFIYVFDARAILDTALPRNGNIVRVLSEDFILRSVVGMSTVGGAWRYYNASNEEAMSNLANTNIRWPVVVEKFYPAHSQIRFDLSTIAKVNNADGNPVSLIGFQGAKRVSVGQFGFSDYRTDYEYWEAPYTYLQDVTIDFFADGGAAARRFNVEITDGDFELQLIAISETTGGPGVALPVDPFLIELFDPSNYNSLSADAVTGISAPMSPRWLNSQQGQNFFSIFPVPTLVYPIRSIIRFDITSLIDTAGGTRTFQFAFHGVTRRPCAGPNADAMTSATVQVPAASN